MQVWILQNIQTLRSGITKYYIRKEYNNIYYHIAVHIAMYKGLDTISPGKIAMQLKFHSEEVADKTVIMKRGLCCRGGLYFCLLCPCICYMFLHDSNHLRYLLNTQNQRDTSIEGLLRVLDNDNNTKCIPSMRHKSSYIPKKSFCHIAFTAFNACSKNMVSQI